MNTHLYSKVDLTEDDKDHSLREDIRRLGRILGDTVRNQHGAAIFDLIERVRQNSIRFRRDADQAARAQLESTLDTLTSDETTQVIRAFSYFSHLVNLAEDQHHVRRTRAHLIAGSASRRGSLAHTIEALYDGGHSTRQLLDFFQTAENQVGTAREIGPVQAVAITQTVKEPADEKFGSGVLALHRPHGLASRHKFRPSTAR